jgi:hypothetical protein
MDRHILAETEIPARLLFKLARRIGHIESAAAVTDRQAVREDVLAKPDRHLGVERFHKPVAKNISGNDVRMAGTED